jgi:alanine dehydrogenase
VVVERDAGAGSGIADEDFARVGARIGDVADAWGADLVLKVKEPQPEEFAFLREDQVLFTYLHLAANPGVAQALVAAGGTGIAYETVEDGAGRLPLLAPMSEIAGKLATQAGAFMLERPLGGRGLLLGGVAGVAPGNVMVIGAGIVGINAAMVAIGMQAHVSVLDSDLDRLRELELVLGGRVELLHSTQLAIEELLPRADLVVGAVLLPGARAPRLVSRAAIGLMRPGSVVVDVAVDQGGCFETTRPTIHSDPVYTVDGVIHYCVTNMPGAVPVTSTRALCNATLPHVTWLADMGVNGAIDAHPGLEPGVNVRSGRLVNPTVAEALRT